MKCRFRFYSFQVPSHVSIYLTCWFPSLSVFPRSFQHGYANEAHLLSFLQPPSTAASLFYPHRTRQMYESHQGIFRFLLPAMDFSLIVPEIPLNYSNIMFADTTDIQTIPPHYMIIISSIPCRMSLSPRQAGDRGGCWLLFLWWMTEWRVDESVGRLVCWYYARFKCRSSRKLNSSLFVTHSVGRLISNGETTLSLTQPLHVSNTPLATRPTWLRGNLQPEKFSQPNIPWMEEPAFNESRSRKICLINHSPSHQLTWWYMVILIQFLQISPRTSQVKFH